MTSFGRYRIGFDIGGTFTDFILLDTQHSEIRLHKCLTTPHDPSVGVLKGLNDLRALAQVVQGRAEGAIRTAIRALPDGVYTSEIWNNPLGEKLRYPAKITVRGDAIELDFDGAPSQLPRGGLNCTYSYTAAHATYPMKCLLSPDVRGNAGCYRPFIVKAPAGSVLNCKKPLRSTCARASAGTSRRTCSARWPMPRRTKYRRRQGCLSR